MLYKYTGYTNTQGKSKYLVKLLSDDLSLTFLRLETVSIVNHRMFEQSVNKLLLK